MNDAINPTLVVTSEIHGQHCSTETYRLTDPRVAIQSVLEREDPFQQGEQIEADTYADYAATYEKWPSR